MNPLATLKSKTLNILVIILTTLLIASYMSGKSDREELRVVSDKLVTHVRLNESLSEQNLLLLDEIKNKPVEYIKITKEVEKEICNGVVKQTLINELPSKPSKKDVINEETTADIDDRLPDNLLKLLK